MKKLIVTADDYGMSRGVNAAIDAGIAAGLITSTNVMTNMEYYKEAEKLRKTKASVGLHWTVSAGYPVCGAEDIPTLVNTDGKFFPYPVFRKRYRDGKISDEDIKKELKAQYERFTEVCGEPDYWNTHQNTHVDFKIFKLFVLVAKELGIKKMRSHKRVYIPSSDGKNARSLKWRLVEPIKIRIIKGWLSYAEKNGMRHPYGVALALKKDDLKDLKYCFSHMETRDDTVTEYVIHPSADLDSEYFGSIGENRIREYKQFTSEDQRNILASNGFELVNFDDI